MALEAGFPSGDGVTTHAAARRDLEGMVVRNAAGKMRDGVFYAHPGDLFTRRPDMRLDIPEFRAVQDKGGACFIAGVGATTTPAFDAAPAANKRIDLLYLTQELASLDGTTETIFGIVKGTASPTPTVPALPAAVSDAIPWATVEIPAGATSMQSGGVIITPVYPYTAMAGGTVVVRNAVELAAWTPADGAKAFNLADTGDYARAGGVWEPTVLYQRAQTVGNSSTPITGDASIGPVTGGGACSLSITLPRARKVMAMLSANYVGTSDSYFGLIGSGATTIAEIITPNPRVAFMAAASAHIHLEVPMDLNAGTTLIQLAGKASGGAGTRQIYDPSITLRGL